MSSAGRFKTGAGLLGPSIGLLAWLGMGAGIGRAESVEAVQSDSEDSYEESTSPTVDLCSGGSPLTTSTINSVIHSLISQGLQVFNDNEISFARSLIRPHKRRKNRNEGAFRE